MALSEAAKRKVNEYNRKWRKKNPEKVREYNERYWEKRAAQDQQGQQATDN